MLFLYLNGNKKFLFIKDKIYTPREMRKLQTDKSIALDELNIQQFKSVNPIKT